MQYHKLSIKPRTGLSFLSLLRYSKDNKTPTIDTHYHCLSNTPTYTG